MKLIYKIIIALLILIAVIWWGNKLIKKIYADPQEENIFRI